MRYLDTKHLFVLFHDLAEIQGLIIFGGLDDGSAFNEEEFVVAAGYVFRGDFVLDFVIPEFPPFFSDLVTDVLRWLGPLLIEGGVIEFRHLQHHVTTFVFGRYQAVGSLLPLIVKLKDLITIYLSCENIV
jgi:hypothetical protein